MSITETAAGRFIDRPAQLSVLEAVAALTPEDGAQVVSADIKSRAKSSQTSFIKAIGLGQDDGLLEVQEITDPHGRRLPNFYRVTPEGRTLLARPEVAEKVQAWRAER